MTEPYGCLYDEEGTYYQDNDGNEYSLNPFGECGTIEEECDGG